MGSLTVFGQEPDPAKRLRKKQGERLREIRSQFRGLTIQQVVDAMNEMDGISITQQAVSLWEGGKTTPRPHMQVAICKILDVSPSTIWNLDAEVA